MPIRRLYKHSSRTIVTARCLPEETSLRAYPGHAHSLTGPVDRAQSRPAHALLVSGPARRRQKRSRCSGKAASDPTQAHGLRPVERSGQRPRTAPPAREDCVAARCYALRDASSSRRTRKRCGHEGRLSGEGCVAARCQARRDAWSSLAPKL